MKERWSKKGAWLALLLLPLMVLHAPLALAGDFAENFSFNGFYTLDASLSNGGDVVLPSATQAPTILTEGVVNFDNSLLGLQLDYTPSDWLSITAQGMIRKQRDGRADPILNWAYVTLDLGYDLRLRGGKMQLPFLQGTELHYVGFSRLWVRPLIPTSGAGGFDEYTGAELSKRFGFGDYNLSFLAAYGRADHLQNFIKNSDTKLISARIEKEGSWINLSLLNFSYDAYSQRDQLIQENANALLISVETELLVQSFVLNAGLTTGWDEFNPEEKLGYLSLGYRIGAWTPYALYQKSLQRFRPFALPPTANGTPAPRPANVRDGERGMDSFGFGLRYDITPQTTIKAQANRRFTHDDSSSGPEQRITSEIYSIAFEGTF